MSKIISVSFTYHICKHAHNTYTHNTYSLIHASTTYTHTHTGKIVPTDCPGVESSTTCAEHPGYTFSDCATVFANTSCTASAWKSKWAANTLSRMKKFGINTIGAWVWDLSLFPNYPYALELSFINRTVDGQPAAGVCDMYVNV